MLMDGTLCLHGFWLIGRACGGMLPTHGSGNSRSWRASHAVQFRVVYTVRWNCIQDMLVRFSPKDVVHMFVDGALRRNDLVIVSWHCVYRVHVALCS